MATFSFKSLPFECGVVAALALAVALPAAAQTRVGVTSAADGDPLGKPPAQSERVLRVGIDIQANEAVTTAASDRAHLVFLDGTSLSVGPNARIVIDKFVYDPAAKTGELVLTASAGVMRLVGGRISKRNAIAVNTPAAYVGIRGGIAIIDVQASRTTADFLFGRDLAMTAQGVTQTLTRAGSQVVANLGAVPNPPTPIPPGVLARNISSVEGRAVAASRSNPALANGGSAQIAQGTSGLAAQPSQAVPVNVTTSLEKANWQQWLSPVVTQNSAAVNSNSASAATSLPTMGSATYNGSVSGSDSSGGAFSGTFTMGWNFGQGTGSWSGASSDSVRATATLSRSGSGFAGPLTTSQGGSGSLNGNFLNGGAGVSGGFSGTNRGSTFNGSFSGSR